MCTQMTNPDWFDPGKAHKMFRFGPHRGAWTALCKVLHRDEWPADGVYSPEDVVKRNWKDVRCVECLKFRPEKN